VILLPNLVFPPVIQAPVSKSHMQRELLMSVLANSPSRLYGNFVSLPDDVLSAIQCIESFGATVSLNDNKIEVIPPSNSIIKSELSVYVGESGFLIRNIISIGFLFARRLIIHAKGTLHIQLDASATSQIASGVLIRLAQSSGERSLILTNLVSTPYLQMTVQNLINRGVNLSWIDNCISFDDHCRIQGREIQIDGDWSGAANLLCMGAISNEISVKGLRSQGNQADEHILDILTLYGAQIQWNGDVITVRHSENRSFNCDVTHCPDLFPLLCVLAASANVITGGIKNHEPHIETYNDHRLVLAAMVASTISYLNISLNEVDSVVKSFPEMKLYL